MFPTLITSLFWTAELVWQILTKPRGWDDIPLGVPHHLWGKFNGMFFFLSSHLSCFLTLRNFMLLGRWTSILGLHYSLLPPDMWWVCMKGNKKETITSFSPCLPNNASLKKKMKGCWLLSHHLWYAWRNPRKAESIHPSTQLLLSFIHYSFEKISLTAWAS